MERLAGQAEVADALEREEGGDDLDSLTAAHIFPAQHRGCAPVHPLVPSLELTPLPFGVMVVLLFFVKFLFFCLHL
jgi:hypothetical protein